MLRVWDPGIGVEGLVLRTQALGFTEHSFLSTRREHDQVASCFLLISNCALKEARLSKLCFLRHSSQKKVQACVG